MKKLIYILLMLSFSNSYSLDFKKETITLGKKKIVVEIARTASERSQGLMFRQRLEKDTGMLFIFDQEQILNFWMKNTFIPLSIGFFDKDKKLLETLEMEPVKSEMEKVKSVYSSKKPAKYAIEAPSGFFKANKISKGIQFQCKNIQRCN